MRAQTRAQSSAVCLGRVPRGCSRRHTSMAHEEATLQRCRSAAAVAVAFSPHKTCSPTYLQSRRFGGLHPARTHAATKARCAPRLRPGLRNLLPAPRAGVRGLYIYGTCFPTAASERSSATNGSKIDKPLKNARVCIHTRMEN
jgi:hypothetical protein